MDALAILIAILVVFLIGRMSGVSLERSRHEEAERSKNDDPVQTDMRWK